MKLPEKAIVFGGVLYESIESLVALVQDTVGLRYYVWTNEELPSVIE